MFSLWSVTLANFSFSAFLLAVQTAFSFLHANIYLCYHPPSTTSVIFSDISLLPLSFHNQVCFLRMPFFVHPKVFSVAESKPCFYLDQISSTCSPELSFISSAKFSRRSSCWSFHVCRLGTNFLLQSSLFTILASQTSSLCWVTLFIRDNFRITH